MKTSNAKLFNKIALVSTVALAAGWGVSAQAGTAIASLDMTAEVIANCTINAAPLSASGYDYVVANKTNNLDVTSTINVVCTKGTGATIDLDTGDNDRKLKNGTNFLTYQLYKDNSRVVPWGSALDSLSITGTGLAQSETVYARINGGQNVPAGSYTDTVTATINF
ncbi:Csu type fimbrial protein [Acinetobacter sp. TSRC1-2]|uniref:Csu type fimbrial protein n=1 Tax=unclassified Acinetobacter TaxID=196816 RepID=UPI003CEA0EBA